MSLFKRIIGLEQKVEQPSEQPVADETAAEALVAEAAAPAAAEEVTEEVAEAENAEEVTEEVAPEEEAEPELNKPLELYKVIRKKTEKSETVSRSQLLFQPPEGLEKEDVTALLDSLNGEERPEELKDITWVKGRKDVWYYDGTIMTPHYAELYSMIQEKDLLHTIASVARSDSHLYPLVTSFRKLMDVPFRMTEDELLGAEARFMLSPEYEDIRTVTASNGVKGFYSTKYLTWAYADSLHEWYEVGMDENP